MTFWELLSAALGSAGLFASVLGAFLAYAARKNGEATRALTRDMEARTAELLAEMDRRATERHREVTETFERMDERAAELRREVAQVFERMDQRADERHREVVEAFQRMDSRGEERHREAITNISGQKRT
jgi:chromosome segregation ATPase